MSIIQEYTSLLKNDLQDYGLNGLIRNQVRIRSFFAHKHNWFNELKRSLLHDGKGTNVYDRDWDVLVILDCATPRMMTEVKQEYDFINSVDQLTSVGSCSPEWMRYTFTEEYRSEMSETIYITGNANTADWLDKKGFFQLDEVWKDGWDDDIHTVPPRSITDRAIYYYRKHQPERMILHYMQPHLPFVAGEISSWENGESKSLVDLHYEKYTKEELWHASVDNLRYALDDVELLLSNIGADQVVLSADHGQAFGEYAMWDHPCYTYIDQLVQVPWCVTSGTDTGEYQPRSEFSQNKGESDVDVEDRLRALGYK